MSNLEQNFDEHKSAGGRAIYKELSFRMIYERLLSPFKGGNVTLVEIGVGYGGCLQMWKEYLGLAAKIYGIDKEDRLCYEEPQIKCIVGDQGDRSFLKVIPAMIPRINVLIDDGSHVNSDQISTFEEIFPHLERGGIYFCEDTHTSYREKDYGGGYKKEGTFIEYCKNLIDALYHTEDERIQCPDVAKTIESISFYRSLVVIKKS
ncbi:class I SAM-dependent methyltransferase [Patescibacteria group bacterium]|uniref:Putative methyltransferase n=1 Tax=viral metagenome TaxID=1070528 RepID=A0A6M3IRB1_9ZZZZ|nr:class I SAM-dependent methyltransferase [Patescibacteria group bacterium]